MVCIKRNVMLVVFIRLPLSRGIRIYGNKANYVFHAQRRSISVGSISCFFVSLTPLLGLLDPFLK